MRSLLITTILLYVSPAAFALDQYEFRMEDDLSAVEVRACFDGKPPQQIYRHRDAHEFTEWLRLNDREIKTSSRQVSLRQLAEGGCVSWRVNLKAASEAGDYRLALGVKDAILTAGSLWFWRDGKKRDIEVRTQLPAGVMFSTPWLELPTKGDNKLYRPAATSASWTSRLALGRFTASEIEVGGAQLRLAMLGDFSSKKQVEMQQWINEPAQAVAAVIGRFPQQQTQILIVDSGPRSSPVIWAHVVRGGGMAVEFFIDQSRPLEDFRKNWTATHELSHLLLPYVSSQDRWLSEGLASYYQNVLRARDGRLSEKQAWEKLIGGFDRGENDSQRGGTMNTYWRGASILLQADAKLRAVSGGQQSLDSALALLHECCYDPGRRWLARELFEELDRLTGYGVFGDVYSSQAWDEEFPDPQPTLEKLGVDSRWGLLKLNDNAPWSHIRQLIMNHSEDAPNAIKAAAAAGQ